MKRILSSVVLGSLLWSQLQIGVVYASQTQAVNQEKQKSEMILSTVEQVIDAGVEKLDKKIKNQEVKDNLQKKNEEIKDYLDEVKKDISNDRSTKTIQAKVEEAKKVVVLKVVSGTTQYENVEENIPNDVARNYKERKQAVETLQDSLLDESGDYSIIVSTKKSLSATKKLFDTFDDTIEIREMYELDGENFFEVVIETDSIFRQEMLEDIESGILPESFVGVRIVLPEVFGINEISLSGENISQTWGIERYSSYSFFDSLSEKSQKVRVAVIDTGIDYTHPDLKNNVNQSLGKDFVNKDEDAYDDQGHGTHVAGTIAANINGSGIIGVNPYVELIPLKICTNKGFCPSYAVLRALEYAKEQKIDILNMSLGGRGNPSGHAICKGISSVVESGGIVIAASGNSNIDTSRFVPGGCSDAISVAAVDSSGKRAVFSNYGSKVDVAAPGVDVYSTYPVNKGSYKKLSGTSMATPHIVGLVSLIQSYKPSVSVAELKSLFQKYPVAVQTDSGKSIAKAVDVPAMMKELSAPKQLVEEQVEQQVEENQKQEESVVEETVADTSSIEEEESFYEILLDGVTYITEKINFIPNQKEQDEAVKIANLKLESEIQTNFEEIDLGPASVDLNLFGEDVEINSAFTGATETGVLDVESVAKIPEIASIPTQIFDTDGKILPVTEINNDADYGESVTGALLPDDFDINNLPEFERSFEEELFEINNIETPETQELFIGGAEKGVEINSADEEVEGRDFDFENQGEIVSEPLYDEEGNIVDIESLEAVELQYHDLDFDVTQELVFEGAERGVEINSLDEPNFDEMQAVEDLTTAPVFEQDFGDLESELQDMEEVSLVEESIEILQPTQEDVLIGDAEKGVEINSLGDDEEFEAELIEIPELDELAPEFILGDDITGYEGDDSEESGVEINSLGAEEEELGEMLPVSGVQEVLEYSESVDELYIDGAESGVEINSFGSDDAGEKVEIEEYNPDSIELLKPEAIVIETPEDLASDDEFMADGDDDLGDEYVLQEEYYEEEEVATEEDIGMGIQNTYTCTIEVGGYCQIYFYKSYRYQFTTEVEGIADRYSSRRVLQFRGRSPGSTTYSMYRYGRHYLTVYVTVKEPAPPIEYTLEVEPRQWGYLYLPTNSYYYKYSYNNTGLYPYVYQYRNRISIMTYRYGSIDYRFVDPYTGQTKYIIHVKSIPPKPTEIEINLMQGGRAQNYLYDAHYYQISSSDWSKADIYRNSRYIYTYAKEVGESEIYLKRNGIHMYTLKIKVTEPPKPIEYTVNIVEGQYQHMYLPQREYTGGISGKGFGGRVRIYNYSRYGFLQLWGDYMGKVEYYINDSTNAYIKYKVTVNVIPKPPVEHHVSMYQTRAVWKYMRNMSPYTISAEDSSMVSVGQNRWYIGITGKEVGSTKVYLKEGEVVRHIFYVEVKEPPKPIEYSITIYQNQPFNFYLPSARYEVYRQAESTGSSYFYANKYYAQNNIWIKGIDEGLQVYYIYNRDLGFHLYTLKVKVVTKEPIVHELELYEGRTIYLGVCSAHQLAGEVNEHVQFYKWFTWYRQQNHCYVKGLTPGDAEVLLKANNTGEGTSYNENNHLYKIKVLPIPKPVEYTLKFSYGNGSANAYLPDSISNYNVRVEGDNIYDRIRTYEKHFWIDVERVGTSKIILSDKKYGFARYVIHVVSEPHYKTIEINQTDLESAWYHQNYNFNIKNRSIVNFRSRKRDYYLYGIHPGETEIHVSHYKYGLRQIWKVKVNPIPKPIVVECETQVDEKCELRVKNGGYYYSTNIPYGNYDVDSYRDRFRFESERSGEFTAYIRSFYGNYITHILKIKVKPEPPQVEICDMAVNGICDLGWIRTNSRSLIFKTTHPGLVDVLYNRGDYGTTKEKWKEYDRGLYDYDYRNIQQGFRYRLNYKLRPVKEGKGEIYIYDGREHLYTVKINSFIAKPIKLDEDYIKIQQGEKYTAKIEQGGGKYSAYEDYEDLDKFSVSSDKEDGFYLETGEINIQEATPGNYYPVIKDRYNQTERLKVIVKKADMVLSTYSPSYLKVGDWYNVEVFDRYLRVEKVEQTDKNGKIDTRGILYTRYVRDTRDNTEYIRIKGLKDGYTTLRVTDAGGNVATLDIKIGSGKFAEEVASEKEEKEESTSSDSGGASIQQIRYIRDYLNGSNVNSSSHWIEIEAFEKGSGKNIALGKKVTSPKSAMWGNRPYSFITDGKKDLGNYSTSGQSDNYVIVDLGKKYDIEKINILHYYSEGRVFKGTKTQVSEDGTNWVTLHDSATQGTYTETSAGRSYSVGSQSSSTSSDSSDGASSESQADDELKKLLDELFSGLGIQSVEGEEGVEVNSIENEGLKINVSGYLYERWNKAASVLTKSEKGREIYGRVYNIVKKFEGKHPNDIYILIDKIEELKEKYEKYNNIYINAVIELLISGLYIEAETYWQNNEEERSQEEIRLVRDIGDILGVKNAGDGLAAAIVYWQGVVKDDPYLSQVAKDELYSSLDALKGDVNPAVRIKKWKKFYNKVKKAKSTQILNDIEVKKTLERILKGEGKYPQDGGVFKNNELRLPTKSEGYYKEWTIDTPGLSHRGAKRIVVGMNGEKYYTDDHYKTFIKIK